MATKSSAPQMNTVSDNEDQGVATMAELSSTLPEIPEYITGAFVHDYIEACASEVQERFNSLCTLRGIEIPDDSNVLRTEQVELFMDAI